MTGVRLVPDEARCTAKSKSTGDRCGNWAIKGARVCRDHGGLAPAVQAKAKRRLIAQRAEADARAVLAFEGIESIDDPFEELSRLAAEVVAMKDALGQRVNSLEQIRYSAAGAGTEQIRGELQLLSASQDRASKILKMLIDSGFEERRVKVAERTSAVLEAFLVRMGLSGDPAAEKVLVELLAAEDKGSTLHTAGESRKVRMSEEQGAKAGSVVEWMLSGLGLAQDPWARGQLSAGFQLLSSGAPMPGAQSPTVEWWTAIRAQADCHIPPPPSPPLREIASTRHPRVDDSGVVLEGIVMPGGPL